MTKPKRDAETRAERTAWCEWWISRGVHMALLEFSATHNSRYSITEPFVVGGNLYATDGKCLVRQKGPIHEDILSVQSASAEFPPVLSMPWPKQLPEESAPLPPAFPGYLDLDYEDETAESCRLAIRLFGSTKYGLASHFAMRLRSLGATTIYRIDGDSNKPYYVPISESVDALVMPFLVEYEE